MEDNYHETGQEADMEHHRLTERQDRILRHIQDAGFATIDSMAESFGVSAQTVRRDLIALERSDYLIRFHGGAGPGRNMVRLGHAEKSTAAQDGKTRIAQAVAKMIPEGAAVYLDVGSTVEAVARALTEHRHLRIVTPGAAVAMIFATARQIDVFLTGGSLRGANGALVGEHAKETLRRFRFDHMVTSFGGFSPEGEPMDFDPEKAILRRIALENSLQRIGVVDASKFHRHALAKMHDGVGFTDLVTDAPPPEQVVAAMARSQTRITVVEAPQIESR
ncbi:DeoR/GlpR family DNA-binding transcription regulator [Paracoccus sp. (in: a-proteobacteria)]|uniref:DeoR/GlpR family DNA-binding transcription regulator n=1 Tax=Paracoccus sp. TaxID=267 RepID=UPI002AFF243D|nr:DeoR/GlpR family DNA-binding transcription regulator [Paracoccus sp. (in: a-proteobacteria)]